MRNTPKKIVLALSLLLSSGLAWAGPVDSKINYVKLSSVNFTNNYLEGNILDYLHIALTIVCLLTPIIVIHHNARKLYNAEERGVYYGLSIIVSLSMALVVALTASCSTPLWFVFVEIFWIFVGLKVAFVFSPNV
ncbi:hypothetical protein ACJU26_05845 [Acidithiobacillus sp. M4-SHS-6]|uniref:hypothetical protein n=1 Tax=Acidithiobacillus sp. M4-SHS-6 TaxID=3383024 RepID=UPI0039BDD7D7